MKKYLSYVFGLVWLLFLILIGKTADDLLWAIMDLFDLAGVHHIGIYVSVIAIIMLMVGFFLIYSTRTRQIDKITILRILIGSLIGGIGSVWLAAMVLSSWLARIPSTPGP